MRLLRHFGLAAGLLWAMAILPVAIGEAAESGDPIPLTPSPAPPELRLSLREAMEAALDNNPNVRLFKERIEEARAATVTQRGALLPNLSSNVRQSRQTFFLGTVGLAPVRTDPFSIFDARANISQSIFSLSLVQRWKASREALKVSELESEATKLDTMATVALLYVESLKAEATVRAREANFQLLQELLERALSRRGGGMATGLDTARLEAQLENERHNLSVVRYEVDRLQVNLIHAMGIPFDVRVILTDQLQTDIPHVPTIPEAVSTAIANRAEIKAQTQRIRTASLTLKSTESERIPSLVGQGDYGLIGNRVHNTLDTYNVAALLSIPIFDGGQREGRISESRSQVRQETIRMQVVANQVVLEVREALITLASAREQFGIAQSGLKAALTELVLARERFSVLTSGNNLELTNATFSLARARENAVDAMFRLNASRVNLARGTGQLEKLQ